MNAQEAFEKLNYDYENCLDSIEEKAEVEKFKQLFIKWALASNKLPKEIKVKKQTKKD